MIKYFCDECKEEMSESKYTLAKMRGFEDDEDGIICDVCKTARVVREAAESLAKEMYEPRGFRITKHLMENLTRNGVGIVRNGIAYFNQIRFTFWKDHTDIALLNRGRTIAEMKRDLTVPPNGTSITLDLVEGRMKVRFE